MERHQYQSMIWTYERRREQIKSKYQSRKGGDHYKNRIKKIKSKIDTWRWAIKRIDARNEKIRNLVKEVNSFFETDIRNGKENRYSQKYIIAINVFYKYGMEELKIQGAFLSKFLNKKYTMGACKLRRKFTKSFRTSQTNKETYHNFKEYIIHNKAA